MTSSVHPPALAVPCAAGAGPSLDPLGWVREAAQALTARERAALTALATGHTQNHIAARMRVSSRTLRRAIVSATRRLGAADALQAVAIAAACGALDPGALVSREVPVWPVAVAPRRPAAAVERRAEFARLRDEDVPAWLAARKVGVCRETGYRYERERLARALAAGGG